MDAVAHVTAHVLTAAVVAVPVLIVLGTALVMTIGGVIGCTRCFLDARGMRRWGEREETEPVREARLSS